MKVHSRAAPPPSACEVRSADLGTLEHVHRLLSALNDKYAGSFQTEDLVDKIPVLKARCIRRALERSPRIDGMTLAQALALIGNRGLETELLGVLEDMTCLKAELDALAER